MNASPFTSTASRTAHSALPVPAPIVRQLPPFQKWLGFSEWLVVVVIALIALGLHLRFVTHVGGLWRDEANSIQLSSLPSFAQVWQHLDFDSFPILFFAVLRAWTGIFGHSDTALRGLGLLIGLAVLIAMWINARAVGAHLPVLSFALIGLNPMIIRYGDSTRAYGLGILLILLTFRSFWRLVESPLPATPGRIFTATVFAIASVQCLYYNSVLLLAISMGAIVVALRERAWRTVFLVLGIGLAGAISLLPYVPIMRRMHEWTFLVKYQISFGWLWKRSCEVLASPAPVLVWLWVGLFVVAIGITIGLVFLRRCRTPVLFAGVTCAVAVPTYAIFLRVLSYYTQPWYYITLIVLVACSFDVVFGVWRDDKAMFSMLLRLRVLIAVAVAVVAAFPAWSDMPIRHTNVDLVAARLQLETKSHDVVIVSYWQYAVSLNRYYHGPAEVITLPPVSDHRFHRYDLALQQMKTADPLQPAYRRMEEVLREGHNVFVVGRLPRAKLNVPPPILSLGYHEPDGTWHPGNYDWIWPLLAAYFIQSHAISGAGLPLASSTSTRVQDYEDLTLGVVRGWR